MFSLLLSYCVSCSLVPVHVQVLELWLNCLKFKGYTSVLFSGFSKSVVKCFIRILFYFFKIFTVVQISIKVYVNISMQRFLYILFYFIIVCFVTEPYCLVVVVFFCLFVLLLFPSTLNQPPNSASCPQGGADPLSV